MVVKLERSCKTMVGTEYLYVDNVCETNFCEKFDTSWLDPHHYTSSHNWNVPTLHSHQIGIRELTNEQWKREKSNVDSGRKRESDENDGSKLQKYDEEKENGAEENWRIGLW